MVTFMHIILNGTSVCYVAVFRNLG